MDTKEFQSRINSLSSRWPFTAFAIELCDGTRFEVDQPHMISMRDDATFVVSSPGLATPLAVADVYGIGPSEATRKAWAEIDRLREENARLYPGPDIGVDIIREMRDGRHLKAGA